MQMKHYAAHLLVCLKNTDAVNAYLNGLLYSLLFSCKGEYH